MLGAAYGGYSVFLFSQDSNNRFKDIYLMMAFSTHKVCLRHRREVFFNNWDFGGAYWGKDNKVAQKKPTLLSIQ
jgi:hypothetical protein